MAKEGKMKFKKGDKVRVIGKNRYCREFRGKVYPIYSIWPGDPHPYQLNVLGRYPIFCARELEKVNGT